MPKAKNLPTFDMGLVNAVVPADDALRADGGGRAGLQERA